VCKGTYLSPLIFRSVLDGTSPLFLRLVNLRSGFPAIWCAVSVTPNGHLPAPYFFWPIDLMNFLLVLTLSPRLGFLSGAGKPLSVADAANSVVFHSTLTRFVAFGLLQPLFC